MFNGTDWTILFDASASAGPVYYTNSATGDQFEWTGEFWQNSYEGTYREGWWRLYV
jgi:hypothetical protein